MTDVPVPGAGDPPLYVPVARRVLVGPVPAGRGDGHPGPDVGVGVVHVGTDGRDVGVVLILRNKFYW